jgi:hypothetical protein
VRFVRNRLIATMFLHVPYLYLMKSLTKKEIEFLESIEDCYPEPWATMASDAILWDNRQTLRDLKEILKKNNKAAKV